MAKAVPCPERGFFIRGNPRLIMKRLYRSKKERILGGVCGGLAGHTGVDPSIIRLVWIVVTLISIGLGIVIYLAAWIIVPEDPGEASLPAVTGG